MIHRVFSTLPTFKNLTFRPGLNVLVADRTAESTDRQTRNRAGKSSLLEIIHFTLGANAGQDSIFRNPPLTDFEFGLEFDLGPQKVIAQRSGDGSAKVYLEAANTADWPVAPKKDDGTLVISNEHWKDVLGAVWFKLNSLGPAGEENNHPTFRSLFSYFVRRETEGGLRHPERQSEVQGTWDQQVALSYLLGLDWTVAQKVEQVRTQEKALKELKKIAKEGALGDMIPSAGELKTQLVLAEEKVSSLRQTLGTFEVLPEYRSFEREASAITLEINELVDANTIDEQLIASMEGALKDEAPPAETDVDRVYAEAGVALPDAVRKRLEDVREFHQSIVANRRSYLTAEITAARQRINEREGEKQRRDRRRAEIMRLLQSKGALEQFQALQGELSRTDATTASLRSRLEAAEQLESKKVDLSIKRGQLAQRLQLNLKEQESRVVEAIRCFESVSQALYEDAGALTLSPTPHGLEIEIKIQGQRSRGIGNMQVFCFDMMLMRLAANRSLGPGFLIHDSHLFDGVDERQVGHALAIGAKQARESGWQYIVTFNSDNLPRTFPSGFNLADHVLPTRLTDARDDGGLFGTRF